MTKRINCPRELIPNHGVYGEISKGIIKDAEMLAETLEEISGAKVKIEVLETNCTSLRDLYDSYAESSVNVANIVQELIFHDSSSHVYFGDEIYIFIKVDTETVLSVPTQILKAVSYAINQYVKEIFTEKECPDRNESEDDSNDQRGIREEEKGSSAIVE